MFSTGFTSLSVLFLFPISITFLVFVHSISFNVDEVLSINPSAIVFVFGDFNVHHKDWLTYSCGTDRSGELCYSFSVSNELALMVDFPTQIPKCDCHSPALLDLFLSSDASFCSTMAFRPLGSSDHAAVSVFMDFHHMNNGMAHFITFLMTILVIIWEMFHGRISLNSVLLLLLVNFVRGFRWNWCIYLSLKVSGQSSVISMVSSCFCCCQSL